MFPAIHFCMLCWHFHCIILMWSLIKTSTLYYQKNINYGEQYSSYNIVQIVRHCMLNTTSPAISNRCASRPKIKNIFLK